jgi:hypothetical protein
MGELCEPPLARWAQAPQQIQEVACALSHHPLKSPWQGDREQAIPSRPTNVERTQLRAPHKSDLLSRLGW